MLSIGSRFANALAKRRAEADLNRSYAHVSKSSWQNAVRQLHDSLLDMGFEKIEAANFIDTAPPSPSGGAQAEGLSPAEQKVPFLVPQLYCNLQGDWILAERDAFLGAGGWKLANYTAEISEADFKLTESGAQWEIDVNAEGMLTEKVVGTAEQYTLDLVGGGQTQEELCKWLELRVRQHDVTQPVLRDYVRRALAYLQEKRGLSLAVLFPWRYVLIKVLTNKIRRHRSHASKSGYEKALFASHAAVKTSFDNAFNFQPDGYAPHSLYVGHPYLFQKHYYPDIGELDNTGEEYDCAKALDSAKGIKHWVRNLDQRGFWLPLGTGKFYPDFVAELEDGRILVVEHKGKVYATNDDSKEKARMGKLWEESSNGKALFLMTAVDKHNPSLGAQIAKKIQETL